MPDVAHVHRGSLRDVTISLLFELKNEYGGFVDYVWFTAKIKKFSRRPRDGHLLIEVRFPGESGDTTVGLSDSKVYDVDWVLLSENKEGGMSFISFTASSGSPQSLLHGRNAYNTAYWIFSFMGLLFVFSLA